MNIKINYSIIAAMDNNRIIGHKNKIPWKAKGEQALFKRITLNSVVIMGRNTFQSLPNGALPNRYNAVLSNDPYFEAHGCFTFSSFGEALVSMHEEFPTCKIFVIGGASLYEQTIENANELHITRIERSYEGDAYFPKYDNDKFNLKNIEWFDTNMRYIYYHYIRK